MIATALVDGHALLELVYVSLLAGVGICSIYALAVIGITRSSERRRAGHSLAAALYAALAVLTIAVCVWGIVLGITIMATK